MPKNLSCRLLTPLMLLSLSMVLSAQLALRLTPDKQRYQCFEPVVVRLTISNVSGNTLEFGGDTRATQGKVNFIVDRVSGRHSRKFSNMSNPAATLKLAPGETKELKLILNQYFDMQQEDNYTIRATVSHGRLPRTHISDPVRIDIRDGFVIATRNIGLPSKSNSDVIKPVQINLMRFSDVDEEIYSLRAEDEENVYAVLRLGPYINGHKPQLELDDSCLFHALLQIRSRLYAYYIFGFEGRNMKLLQKRFYVSADGIPPRLSKSNGYLRITHARLARNGVDYFEETGAPASAPAAAPADAKR
jgi:hypothetical protein